jgi:hypothetical protein
MIHRSGRLCKFFDSASAADTARLAQTSAPTLPPLPGGKRRTRLHAVRDD